MFQNSAECLKFPSTIILISNGSSRPTSPHLAEQSRLVHGALCREQPAPTRRRVKELGHLLGQIDLASERLVGERAVDEHVKGAQVEVEVDLVELERALRVLVALDLHLCLVEAKRNELISSN